MNYGNIRLRMTLKQMLGVCLYVRSTKQANTGMPQLAIFHSSGRGKFSWRCLSRLKFATTSEIPISYVNIHVHAYLHTQAHTHTHTHTHNIHTITHRHACKHSQLRTFWISMGGGGHITFVGHLTAQPLVDSGPMKAEAMIVHLHYAS